MYIFCLFLFMHTFPHVMCGVCIFTMGFEFLGQKSLKSCFRENILFRTKEHSAYLEEIIAPSKVLAVSR